MTDNQKTTEEEKVVDKVETDIPENQTQTEPEETETTTESTTLESEEEPKEDETNTEEESDEATEDPSEDESEEDETKAEEESEEATEDPSEDESNEPTDDEVIALYNTLTDEEKVNFDISKVLKAVDNKVEELTSRLYEVEQKERDFKTETLKAQVKASLVENGLQESLTDMLVDLYKDEETLNAKIEQLKLEQEDIRQRDFKNITQVKTPKGHFKKETNTGNVSIQDIIRGIKK